VLYRKCYLVVILHYDNAGLVFSYVYLCLFNFKVLIKKKKEKKTHWASLGKETPTTGKT